MTTTADRIYDKLGSLDGLAEVTEAFDSLRATASLAAAIAHYADEVMLAQWMHRRCAPLRDLRAHLDDAAWIAAVRDECDICRRRLVDESWKSSSSSLLRNAFAQIEASADARFVRALERYFQAPYSEVLP